MVDHSVSFVRSRSRKEEKWLSGVQWKDRFKGSRSGQVDDDDDDESIKFLENVWNERSQTKRLVKGRRAPTGKCDAVPGLCVY